MIIILFCSTQLIKLLSIQFRSSLSLLKHVKYMVFGSFAIQEETIEAIAEAMDIVMESSLFHGRQLYRRNPLPDDDDDDDDFFLWYG